MRPKFFVHAADGAMVTSDEALDQYGVLRDGYGWRTSLYMEDHAAADNQAMADVAAAARRAADAAQAAYEARISQAWKAQPSRMQTGPAEP
jgi:hypothetical protein